jgi:AcrR family transcriptional regulator
VSLPSLDGRLARSARTRATVIDALLALHQEGDLAPTANRVAAKAGVALRTVYDHFSDMEALHAGAGQREVERVLRLSRPPPADLPFPERLDRFVANRAAVLEHMFPTMRAASTREHLSQALRDTRAHFQVLGDAEVTAVFAPELAGLTPAGVTQALHAVRQVAGGPAWSALRIDCQLGPREAGLLLRVTLGAVLTAVLAAGPAGGPCLAAR